MAQKLLPRLALLFSMFAWGSFYPLSKFTMQNLDPLVMGFLRYSVGLIPLLPFYFVTRHKGHPPSNKPIPKKELLELFLLGQLGITLFALFLFLGINLSNASNGSLLANTQPIFAVFLAPLFLKEILSLKRILGALAGFVGLLLVTTGGSLAGLSDTSAFFGNLFLVGASVSMTLYNIFLKKYIRKYGGLIPTVITFAFGTLILLLVVLFTTEPQGFGLPWDTLTLILVLYIGIGATSIPYFLFNSALKEMDVISASGYKFLIPVSGVVLSIFLLKEIPDPVSFIGMIIILGSILFLQRAN